MAGLVGPLAAAAGVHNVMEGAGRSSAGGELRGFAAWSRRLESAAAALRDHPPRLLVAVAHPTFNLPLAAHMPAGVRKILIAPPEIWAWEAGALGRAVGGLIEAVAKVAAKPFSPLHAAHVAAHRGRLALSSLDHLLCLTPMNAAAYGKLKLRLGAAVEVVQVRHLATALVRDAAMIQRAGDLRRRLGLAGREHLLGVFPGSREGEVRLLLPTMLRAARAVAGARTGVRVAVSIADGALEPSITRCAASHGAGEAGGDVILTAAPSSDLLCASCHAILASGTLTLEAAMLAVRATVAYTLPLATRFPLRPLFRHLRIAGRPALFALPNAVLAARGVPRDQLPYREFTLRHFRAGPIAQAILADLPTGPCGTHCPPLLPADSIVALRDALQGPAELPSAGQYVAAVLRDVSTKRKPFSGTGPAG
jgi:lipid A disaccharide synthetase